MSYTDLEDKVVVITGAAQGIGRSYAGRFITEGATVILVDKSQDGVEHAAASLNEDGAKGKAIAHVVDVSDRQSCRQLASSLTDDFGRVDGLVNNAAIFSTIEMKPFWDITDDEWDQIMAVNLRGPWLLTSVLLPLLRASDSASIVNIGSDAVAMGRQGYLHYVASKGGVTGMSFAMSHELGDSGIRVNTLSPGPVYTDVQRGTVTSAQKESMVARQALHRTAGPEDMTSLAAFLISNDSSYITGQTISVNGGLIHR
ncbi:SDR family NAD(P)-dependent oxidoreductase [Pseudarthrobacter oxydans]|uniref:SDR family NAD(P)-dependent oxidoreductase n=1 Tax=Pseudarthrobacter oxydans TaxID=1671 RepID=UPI003813DA21